MSGTVLSLWKGRIERDPVRAAAERIYAEEAEAAGIPLPRLLNPRTAERAVSQARRRALARILNETGAPIADIARKVGVDRRCVQKARGAA